MRPATDDPAYAERARQRNSWPVRRFTLGQEPTDSLLGSTTAAQRVQMVEELTRDAWAFAGGMPAPIPRDRWPGLLVALIAADVRFLVVGAHAMAAHGTPRATGDLDVWVEPDPENAAKVWAALDSFGAPAEALGFVEEDLHQSGTVWQIGVPPRRVDIMTKIDGVNFATGWRGRIEIDLEGTNVPVIGLESLRTNKKASGRAKDLADLELLPDPNE